ncbi:MAG: heavy metal-binding domain-containing protein [Bacteroidota bacterium]
MKNTILTFGIIIAFVSGTSLLTSCGSNNNKEADASEQHEMDDHDHDSEVMAKTTHVCPMHPEEIGVEGDKCSKCGMALVASSGDMDEMNDTDMAATHACPMHPEETGKEGDKCSKCGMDLVLADAGDDDHDHQH